MKRAAFLTLLALPMAPALAQSTLFSVDVGGELGYSDNPFLRNDVDTEAFSASARVSPTLSHSTSVSTTSLSGTLDLTRYSRRYGSSSSALVELSHTQQLAPTVTMSAEGGYSNSRNALIGVYDEADPLTAGQRRERIYGEGTLNWQVSERDRMAFTAEGSRMSFASAALRGYSIVSGRAYYARRFTERLELGGSLTVTRVDARVFPDSTTYSPQLELTYRLSEIWNFSGGAGVSIRKDAGAAKSNVSPSFSGQLCGTYPRTQVCIAGSRATSASGVSGARETTSLSATVSQTLSERSSVSFSSSYYRTGDSAALPGFAQEAFNLDADYRHQLTQRINLTAGVGYRRRKTGTIGTEGGFAATIGLSTTFGRQR